jgi:hypothetical protein
MSPYNNELVAQAAEGSCYQNQICDNLPKHETAVTFALLFPCYELLKMTPASASNQGIE